MTSAYLDQSNVPHTEMVLNQGFAVNVAIGSRFGSINMRFGTTMSNTQEPNMRK